MDQILLTLGYCGAFGLTAIFLYVGHLILQWLERHITQSDK